MMKCKICGQLVGNLGLHIKVHRISMEDYYIKYMKSDSDGICRYCGKPTKFVNLHRGYRLYCDRNHELKYRWKHDTNYRRMMTENAKRVMTELNNLNWSDDEFRKEFSKRMSRIMTSRNKENWKNPTYRKAQIARLTNVLKDALPAAHKSNAANYITDGSLFYIALMEDKLKIGLTRDEDSLKSKYNKYGRNIILFTSSKDELLDFEEMIKLSFCPVEGLEFFDLSDYGEILQLANDYLQIV